MTRRDRLEGKLAKRQEWAGKATRRSDARFDAVHKIADGIPLGQPILVGHHSEAHARRDAERIDSNMRKGVEEANLAAHHTSKASGLAHQLDTSIFSDDENAIEALEARIAVREAERGRIKSINKEIRKGPGWEEHIKPPLGEKERADLLRTASIWGTVGYPAYVLSNLGAAIRKDKERIKEIQVRCARTAKAEAAGGVVIEGEEYVRVTFADKPDRSVWDALRVAGFTFTSGSWYGQRAKLPASVEHQT